MPISVNNPAQFPPARASELDAVNTIMLAVGESPISPLDGELPADAAIARHILSDVVREVQLEQWHFNQEDDFTLAPEEDSGEILLPANMVSIHFDEPDSANIVVRGGKLYDLTTHSYVFGAPVTGRVTWILPFSDLPEPFRHYCTLRAARRFQDSALGSNDLHTFTLQDEMAARIVAVREDSMQGRYNHAKSEQYSFNTGWKVSDALRRT